MQLGATLANALFTLEWIVLHEGHEHGASSSSSGGLEWTATVGALVFLAVIGVGTWYVYENYGR